MKREVLILNMCLVINCEIIMDDFENEFKIVVDEML